MKKGLDSFRAGLREHVGTWAYFGWELTHCHFARHTAAECRLPLWRVVCLLMGNESETLFAGGRKRGGEW